MTKKKYGGSGLFNDRPASPASARPGDAAQGLSTLFSYPTMGDVTNATTLKPLPTITSAPQVNEGTNFWERKNSQVPVEQKTPFSVTRVPDNSRAGSAITGVDERIKLGNLFANAGNNVGAMATFKGSGTPAGEASSSKGKNKGEDDDWSLASKFMDKSFDFEKRGASIRQGIEGGQNSQNFLYSTSRAMMGLG